MPAKIQQAKAVSSEKKIIQQLFFRKQIFLYCLGETDQSFAFDQDIRGKIRFIIPSAGSTTSVLIAAYERKETPASGD